MFGGGHTREWIVKDFFKMKGSSTILPTYPQEQKKHTGAPLGHEALKKKN